MMDSLHGWFNAHFLGKEWSWWLAVGWLGNAIFSSRFLVQWYATEKKKQVVVPGAFWWMSLSGSLVLLAYSLFYKHDSVFIFSFAFSWLPYMRNLVIHYRHAQLRLYCPDCSAVCPPKSNFCFSCGARLVPVPAAPDAKP
jgi:lipid-A-disaccharide synthase-like uncharacterized protein